MYIQELREMVPPASQKTVVVCNQITLLIIYYISSRQVALLKAIVVPMLDFNIFYLTVICNLINFNFQIFLPFVPEM